MTHGSRADGMFCRVSRSKVDLVPVAFVSTIGLSPVTVTVSWTVESSICCEISALKPTVTRMPSRTTVLKPGSSNFTV